VNNGLGVRRKKEVRSIYGGCGQYLPDRDVGSPLLSLLVLPPGTKGVPTTPPISGHVDKSPFVPAPKLNRDISGVPRPPVLPVNDLFIGMTFEYHNDLFLKKERVFYAYLRKFTQV
jgi:hypothetical protein